MWGYPVSARHALRVLVVGQTPPPLGGQAIAIASFVGGSYSGLRIDHVRMGFSDDMGQMGRVQLRKLGHLAYLVVTVLWRRLRTGAEVLYYPPAGPDLVPVLRDIVFLTLTRWAFRHTVFHFHAAGVAELEQRLPRPLRPLFRYAYSAPDLAITPSTLNPPDGASLGARRVVEVPNGVPDRAGPWLERADRSAAPGSSDEPVVLYVGILRESKGVLVLIDAVRRLRARGCPARLLLVGQFASEAFAEAVTRAVQEAGLTGSVELPGALTGAAKDEAFRSASLFCYPGWFASETFGLVLVEAMQYALPIVATRWRGIPAVVTDGENGKLVDPQDPAELADALQAVLGNHSAAERMGRCGRAKYLSHYTEQIYQAAMEEAIVQVPGIVR